MQYNALPGDVFLGDWLPVTEANWPRARGTLICEAVGEPKDHQRLWLSSLNEADVIMPPDLAPLCIPLPHCHFVNFHVWPMIALGSKPHGLLLGNDVGGDVCLDGA